MNISKSAPAVLYVDERPTLLEFRKATLQSHGLSIETVLSESAAMETLAETSVDAVLLEYKQEGMDGEAIAYHIHQRFPNLPIILISAYCEIPERILWLVDEYVMRSEMPAGLLRAIERVTYSNNPDKAHKLTPRSGEAASCKPAA